jgi:hypothetical protein
MRYAALAAVLGCLACSTGRADAQTGFSDSLCPEATQYVVAAGKLRRDDPPDRVYAAAQAVTDAYERCSTRFLSNGFREPQHYADTRAAQFAVLASRALVALGRPDDARRELNHWRPLAQQVVDWRYETEAYQSGDVNGSATTLGGANNRGSRYQDSAKEIVAAIDAELAQINAPVPKRQGQSSPAPAASPNP